MKHNLRRILAIVLAFTFLISMTACGGTTADTKTTGSTAAAGTGTANNSSSAATTGQGPVEVVWGSFDNQGSLDNFSGATTSVFPRMLQLFQDTLFQSNHDGTYEPWIATDWKWSDDNLHLDINIRDDVYFHSGDKLVADDVKFSLERIAFDMEENSSTYLKGEIDSIVCNSDTSLTVNFKTTSSTFMIYTANHFGILNHSEWEKDAEAFWKNPDTSGPYLLSDYNLSTSVFEFTRWDKWWGWDEKHTTNVDKITYRAITDVTSRVASIRAGECDIIDDVPLDQLSLLTSEGINTGKYERTRPYYFALMCREGRPFSNPDLRKAFSYCLDRQTICDSILGGGKPATCVSSPAMIGYIEGSTVVYDVEEAKALVKASGYNGEEIVYLTSDVICANCAELAQAVQAWGQAVGLNIKVDMLDNASFQARSRSGDYDIRIGGMPCNDGDPNAFVKSFGSKNSMKMDYDNEEFDKLLDEAYITVDTDKRDKLYQQAWAILNEDFAALSVWWPEEGWAMKKSLSGIVFYSDAMFDMRWMHVE